MKARVPMDGREAAYFRICSALRGDAMWNWLQKLFANSPPEIEAAADIHLKARTEAALSWALQKLSPGQEGWITIAEAGRLFSADEVNPLNEMDIEGHAALGRFAADRRHRSIPRLDRSTRRIYFSRSSA